MKHQKPKTHIILFEKRKFDRKSPLRVLFAFFVFVIVMSTLTFGLSKASPGSSFDIMGKTLFLLCLLIAMGVAIYAVNLIFPFQRSLKILLNQKEIVTVEGRTKKALPNKNLKTTQLTDFRMKIQSPTGQSLTIPSNVKFKDKSYLQNKNTNYILRVNLGVVELVKRTSDSKRDGLKTEVLKLPN